MQPLVRFSSRAVLDSISTSTAARIHTRRSPLICLQCKFRTQARHYADDLKPPSPLSSNPPPKPELSPLAASEDASPNEELPSQTDSRRNPLTKRFSHLMDHLQGNIFIASQRINDLTGYSGIEALKTRITRLESHVQEAQDAVRAARVKYKTTVADRAATQREVTTLLARKDSWTPADLERFTSLYRMDHSNEQAVQEAATRLADAESAAEHAAAKLSSSILARYHEEQIWSDKIRRMSTWGTWGLMGVNVLLFLVFQFGFEPWRRRRLVRGFEEKVREALDLEKKAHVEREAVQKEGANIPLDGIIAAGIQELQEEMEDDSKNPDPAIDAVVACIKGEDGGESGPALQTSTPEPLQSLQMLREARWWTGTVYDLFSERIVPMRKQDVTIIALESAATGAAIVTILATLLLRSS